jgi:hypothetical protein
MKYSVGDLVKIVKSSGDGDSYDEPGLIVRVYESTPKIFLYNEEENRRWLEDEDIGPGTVYDIIYNGVVEEAVLAEWISPWTE